MNEEEINDDELEVEVSEEVEDQAGASTGDGDGPLEASAAGTSDEESDGKKPSKFQRRIDDLVHKQREAERQRDEYYKVAQKVMDENNRLRNGGARVLVHHLCLRWKPVLRLTSKRQRLTISLPMRMEMLTASSKRRTAC